MLGALLSFDPLRNPKQSHFWKQHEFLHSNSIFLMAICPSALSYVSMSSKVRLRYHKKWGFWGVKSAPNLTGLCVFVHFPLDSLSVIGVKGTKTLISTVNSALQTKESTMRSKTFSGQFEIPTSIPFLFLKKSIWRISLGVKKFKQTFLKFLASLWKTWVLGCCVKSLRYSRPCTTSLKASQASFSDIGLSVGTTRTSPSFRSSKTARKKNTSNEYKV